jgi:hypothetical protein
MTKRKRRSNERPANLEFWHADGHARWFEARVAADIEISIGRTDSERALGFIVTNNGKMLADFVLDRDQVAELATYLRFFALGRLKKPLGRKRIQVSYAALNDPKFRLRLALEDAAMRAHPGWHRINKHEIEADAGAPSGARLVAWFKRTHPQKAARIERKIREELWKGGA